MDHVNTGKTCASGSIVKLLENEEVLCDIETSVGSVRIKLPNSFFPGDVFFGMPITLYLDADSEVKGKQREIIKTKTPVQLDIEDYIKNLDE